MRLHWLLMISNPVSHTPVREFQHPGTSNSYFYQSVSPQSSPNSPVRWFKEKCNSLLDEKGSKCKHGWADCTCALSNWSLSMSHVHTIVPVRPIEQNPTITHFRQPVFTLNTTKRQTFSSFAMDGDHISGVCRHPLPNTGCVPQHISDSINNKQSSNQASNLAKNSYIDVQLRWRHTYSSDGTLWSSIITRSTL